MSTLTQLIGGSNGPVTSIVNRYSSGGTNSGLNLGGGPGRDILSGALTANTLATVLSVSGRGRLNFASAYVADATSRTVRVKVTIDGVSVFDATSSAIATTQHGIVAVGYGSSSGGFYVLQPIDFNSSLLIEVASSLTETDKITMNIAYEVWS